ncbi:MAG: MerR family transcriptional regulator [Myxococcota bacterium]
MTDSARDNVHALDRGTHRYRMKDLCVASGLPRQAIHFYIQEGLLPPGKKTSRNMAWYSEEHIDRLRLIRQLQHERFLPLKAIKAILDGREEAFAPEQHSFLLEVKEQLAPSVTGTDDRRATTDAGELATRTGVERDELERAVELGLIGASRDAEGRLRIADDDVWMIELFGEMRRIGFSRELGFTVDDLAFYEDAMNQLFQQEARLISSRLSGIPAADAASMIERALPLIHQFLTRYHAARVRDFFATM